MESTRELLSGNVTLTLEVYGSPKECGHPERFKVTLSPKRITQIQQMAQIVSQHRSVDGLNLWSVKAWDNYGDYLNGTEDDHGELQLDELNPERMECNAIVVSDDAVHWEAIIKHTDVRCQTELVILTRLTALAEASSSHG